ncbi:MAG: DUF4129 domain-containing protein [Steroidobacteraceae bacterium]
MGVFSAAILVFFLCTHPCQANSVQPSESEIKAAIQQLKADPNLVSERQTKTLRWRKTGSERPSSAPDWLADFFYWLAQSIRWLMWIVIALLVITLGVLILRRLKNLERAPRVGSLDLPTHVRDLDIRPESLPDDIGANALALWNEGQRRAALALLYRGLLSRLVHVHAVPIKASSTEGDCLQMVEQHLTERRLAYANHLVRVWQRAVYGAHDPESEEVRDLCLGFDAEAGVEAPRSA